MKTICPWPFPMVMFTHEKYVTVFPICRLTKPWCRLLKKWLQETTGSLHALKLEQGFLLRGCARSSSHKQISRICCIHIPCIVFCILEPLRHQFNKFCMTCNAKQAGPAYVIVFTVYSAWLQTWRYLETLAIYRTRISASTKERLNVDNKASTGDSWRLWAEGRDRVGISRDGTSNSGFKFAYFPCLTITQIVHVVYKKNKKEYALKILNKAQLVKKKVVKSAMVEKDALIRLGTQGTFHPGIVRLHHCFHDSAHVCA